jgi:polyisoprenoid-binding protein YceI
MRPMKLSLLLVVFLFLHLVAFAQTRHLDLVKEESSVTYRLVHPLHEIEATSKDIQYILEADPSTKELKHVSAQVDVTTFDSGNSNRDSHAMEVIDAITYPDVTFESTSIAQAGDSVHVTGKLMFHGVTNEVVVAALLKWSEKKLVVQGGFGISLTGFNIERPSLLMIPVADELNFSIVGVFVWGDKSRMM